MKGGWSLDFHTPCPVTGKCWDLRVEKEMQRAKVMIRMERPKLLIVSPPCTALSSPKGVDGSQTAQQWHEAVERLEFTV